MLAKQHTRRTTKEIKTKQVLDKYRKLQAGKRKKMFNHLKYDPITTTETVNGKRYYVTPEGNKDLVTSVTGMMNVNGLRMEIVSVKK